MDVTLREVVAVGGFQAGGGGDAGSVLKRLL